MINNKFKAIFVHVPKTGGTAIKKYLNGFVISGDHNKWEKEKKIAGERWDTFFKFAFVRNPWDRVYSIYSYYRMGKHITGVESNRFPTEFKPFVLNLEENLTGLNMSYNQTEFVGDELDFIGRFEKLNDDYIYIAKKINVRVEKLGVVRKSKRNQDYHTIYDDEMVEIVRNYFQKDIERFDYSYE